MKAKIFGVSHLSLLLFCSSGIHAQQPMGTVGVQDATVAGALEVTNGRAVLVGTGQVCSGQGKEGSTPLTHVSSEEGVWWWLQSGRGLYEKGTRKMI